MTEVAFVMFEKEYLKIKKVVDKSNTNPEYQGVEFTGNLKILYKYMYDRHKFFSSNNKEFFDNQDDIAEAIGVSKRTIVSLMKQLIENKLVSKKVKKTHGAMHSNAYTVQDIFNKVFFDCGDTKLDKSITKSKVNPVAENKPVYKPPVQKQPVQVFDDEEDCPF